MIQVAATALSDDQIKLISAGIGAAITLIVALITMVVARSVARRDRRREMYGKAYRAALEWREMLYRVRRRDPNDSRPLIDRFHELQECVDYYEGWIGSESRYMQRSYQQLVRHVRTKAQPLIQEAWAKDPEKPGSASEDTEQLSISTEANAFLRDVRGFLSLQPWRWIAVAWRNRKNA